MFASDFISKLQKLNKSLWADTERSASVYGHPTRGLYNGTKFIMGIPHYYIPIHSTSAINMERLKSLGKLEVLKTARDQGTLPQDEGGEEVPERLLVRGQKSILSHLLRSHLIDRHKAEKIFRITLEPNRIWFPRNFIHQEF